MFLANLWYAIKWVLAVGFVFFLIGQTLPRSRFHYDRFPFRPFEWEMEGKIYNKFNITKWKTDLPDMSKIFKHVYSKQVSSTPDSDEIKRLIQETCVAENVHWILALLSPYLYVRIDGMTGVLFMILNIIGNIPFIMIQRYNRPRLVKVYDRLLKREERKEFANKNEDNDSAVVLNL